MINQEYKKKICLKEYSKSQDEMVAQMKLCQGKKKAIKFCVITLLDHLLETKQVNPATEEHP